MVELGIIFYYLFVYSFNLNLIEWFWKVMNEYVRNNKYFVIIKDFWGSINYFFDVILFNIGVILSGRINDIF